MQYQAKLIRLSILLITLLASSNLFAIQKISNFIFLGDSLSDIGNIPLSTAAQTSHNKIPFNIYVPFSNPVALSVRSYTVPLQSDIVLHYPKLTNILLPAQVNIDGQQRIYRSINWSEYLLQDIQELHPNWMKAQLLVPWIQLHNPMVAIPRSIFSVDYAFGAALSEDDCRDNNYENPRKDCTAQSIYTAQNYYRTQGNNGEMPNIQIPGLLRQVKLLQQDVADKQVQVSASTIYIIWIGGNDIKKNYYQAQNWQQPQLMYDGAAHLAGGISHNVKQAIEMIAQTEGIRGKRFIVINMYELGLNPYTYGSWWLRNFGHLIGGWYNAQLKRVVKDLQQTGVQVELFDLHGLVNQFLLDKMYQVTLGHACQNQPNYSLVTGNANNCSGYLFWDNFHLTMPVQQLQAYTMLSLLEKFN